MSSIANGKYSAFSADVQTLINKASHINVTISSDNAGANLSNDSNGHAISKKLIVSMNYTYPQDGTLGNYIITFSDGSNLTIQDNNNSHWYILEGIEPYVYKQLE
jgi:hypothetical protein